MKLLLTQKLTSRTLLIVKMTNDNDDSKNSCEMDANDPYNDAHEYQRDEVGGINYGASPTSITSKYALANDMDADIPVGVTTGEKQQDSNKHLSKRNFTCQAGSAENPGRTWSPRGSLDHVMLSTQQGPGNPTAAADSYHTATCSGKVTMCKNPKVYTSSCPGGDDPPTTGGHAVTTCSTQRLTCPDGGNPSLVCGHSVTTRSTPRGPCFDGGDPSSAEGQEVTTCSFHTIPDPGGDHPSMAWDHAATTCSLSAAPMRCASALLQPGGECTGDGQRQCMELVRSEPVTWSQAIDDSDDDNGDDDEIDTDCEYPHLCGDTDSDSDANNPAGEEQNHDSASESEDEYSMLSYWQHPSGQGMETDRKCAMNNANDNNQKHQNDHYPNDHYDFRSHFASSCSDEEGQRKSNDKVTDRTDDGINDTSHNFNDNKLIEDHSHDKMNHQIYHDHKSYEHSPDGHKDYEHEKSVNRDQKDYEMDTNDIQSTPTNGNGKSQEATYTHEDNSKPNDNSQNFIRNKNNTNYKKDLRKDNSQTNNDNEIQKDNDIKNSTNDNLINQDFSKGDNSNSKKNYPHNPGYNEFSEISNDSIQKSINCNNLKNFQNNKIQGGSYSDKEEVKNDRFIMPTSVAILPQAHAGRDHVTYDRTISEAILPQDNRDKPYKDEFNFNKNELGNNDNDEHNENDEQCTYKNTNEVYNDNDQLHAIIKLWEPCTFTASFCAIWCFVCNYSHTNNYLCYDKKSIPGVQRISNFAYTCRELQPQWETICQVYGTGTKRDLEYEVSTNRINYMFYDGNDCDLSKESEQGTYTMLFHNCRGMEVNMPRLLQRQADVQFLTECDIPEYLVGQTSAEARKLKFHTSFGQPTDMAKEAGKRRGRRVAVLAKGDESNVINDRHLDDDARFLKDTGRWHEVLIPTAKEGFHIRVAVVYGIAGASGNSNDYKDNERIMGAAIRRARSFKNEPYILGGDINVDPGASKVISLALRAKWMYDIAEEWHIGTGPCQTTFRAGSVEPGMSGKGTTRIDAVLANDTAKHLISGFGYAWEWAHGFDHVPLYIQIKIDAFIQKLKVIEKPAKINIDDYDPKVHNKEMRDKLFGKIWEKYDDEFEENLSNNNVQGTHDIWCKAMEEFLVELLPDPNERKRKTRTPRGSIMSFFQQKLTKPISPTTFSAKNVFTAIAHQALASCRYLMARCKNWWIQRTGHVDKEGSNEVFWNRDETDRAYWDTVIEYVKGLDESVETPAIVGQQEDAVDNHKAHIMDKPTINNMEAQANVIEKCILGKRQEAQREVRKDKKEVLDKAGKTFYKFLKHERYRGATVINGKDGKPTTNLSEIHEVFKREWEKVYNVHKHKKLDFEDFKIMYEKNFPKEGAPKGPPNGEQLQEQAMKARNDAVGGMDGIAPAELRTLPRKAWDLRAKHLQNAYRNRCSPEAYHHVASPVIHKQDKMDDSIETAYPQPTDFRLISLMSALYRVESGAQYRRHVGWLLGWIHESLHGGLPGHEAAEVSWDAQSDIEEALANKEEMTICLMDYWKFFDAMEPDFVKEFMLACG